MDISAVTIAGLTVYEIIWFFLIYSFLGWVLEVIYHGAAVGVVVNRGFLNGPVCPIYGFGMVFILMLLNIVFPEGVEKANAVALFGFGLAIATSIELIGGWALDKIFHARWWDYSEKPFNLNGYICPEFSLYWGVGTVLAIRILHPFIADITVKSWPKEIAWPVAIILCFIYAADTVVTVMIVNGLNKQLAELDELRSSMRRVSDDLSNALGSTSMKTAQRMEEGRVKAELAKEDLIDQAEERRAELMGQAQLKKAELEAQTAEVQDNLNRQSEAFQSELDKGMQELQKRIQALRDKKSNIQIRQDALYDKILKSRFFGARRLLKAFPDLKPHEHAAALDDIKEKM